MKKLLRWIACHIFRHHQWTSNAMQSIEPTEEEIQMGIARYWDYARAFCIHCGKNNTSVWKRKQQHVKNISKPSTLYKVPAIIFLFISLQATSCYTKYKCPDGSRMKIKMERVHGKPEKNLSY
jgi:hypothetical protein